MIYFIRDEATQHIKIGFTGSDGEDRLRDLQTGCPGQLVLLLQIEGSKQEETTWHDRFAEARLRDPGEWFKPVPELLLAIMEAKVLQLEAENARLRERLEAEYERLQVARAQLGSLSVFAEKSVGVALQNIKRMLEGPTMLPVQRAVIFGC
jgi:hypothetical protein